MRENVSVWSAPPLCTCSTQPSLPLCNLLPQSPLLNNNNGECQATSDSATEANLATQCAKANYSRFFLIALLIERITFSMCPLGGAKEAACIVSP